MDKLERAVKAAEAAQVTANDIYARVNAMLVLTETGGTLTADGTEQEVYINDSPAGVFQPKTVMIDLDNMDTAAGDIMEIKLYYRLRSGGALMLYDYVEYTGTDGGLTNGRKIISIDLLPNRFGLKVTLKQTAGVNKNYDYEIIYEG